MECGYRKDQRHIPRRRFSRVAVPENCEREHAGESVVNRCCLRLSRRVRSGACLLVVMAPMALCWRWSYLPSPKMIWEMVIRTVKNARRRRSHQKTSCHDAMSSCNCRILLCEAFRLKCRWCPQACRWHEPHTYSNGNRTHLCHHDDPLPVPFALINSWYPRQPGWTFPEPALNGKKVYNSHATDAFPGLNRQPVSAGSSRQQTRVSRINLFVVHFLTVSPLVHIQPSLMVASVTAVNG